MAEAGALFGVPVGAALHRVDVEEGQHVRAGQQHRTGDKQPQTGLKIVVQRTSGKFAANAAWLPLAAISHNLLRALGCLADAQHGRARGVSLRRQLIDVPARIARRGPGRLVFHLSRHRPWRQVWTNAFHATHRPPPARAA
jgi:hypothetical protein